MRTLSMWGALLGAALILPPAVEAQDPAGQTATAIGAPPTFFVGLSGESNSG